MKISPIYNINLNYSFKSTKQDVKRADDIVRNSTLNFPVLSSSYMDKHWKILNNDTMLATLVKAYLGQAVDEKIEQMRKTYYEDKTDIYLMNLFRKVKQNRVGNCSEQAQILLGSLYANDIYDAVKASLRVKVDMLSEDDISIASVNVPYDHAVVLANFDNDKKYRNRFDVVLDPWLNKAMSCEEARIEYLNMITKKDLDEITKKAKKAFKKAFEEKGYSEIDVDNAKYHYRVVFRAMTPLNFEQRKQFGEIVKKQFPELCMEF